MSKKYVDIIVRHYETCLEKYGDSHLGVDWPRLEDVNTRYRVMMDIIKFAGDRSEKENILDFGCGAAHLLKYIKDQKIEYVNYTGLDLSQKFISLCRHKFPDSLFYCLDILNSKTILPNFDYIIMNGVFTEKRELSFDDMWEYFCKTLAKAFSMTDKGIAFNVMSKAVDWEREDLFHVSVDLLIDFITTKLTRKFIIRNDYGLYEYTVYIYKKK